MELRSGRYTGHWMTNLGVPVYPPELWAHIFSFLPGYSICRMRLVCRRWRDIVDSSVELLGRLQVTLERLEEADDFVMDEDFVVPPLLPAVHVVLDNWDIQAVDWWLDICQKLRVISLFRCKIDMSLLLKMVKQAPMLECLRLRAVWVRVESLIVRDFQLPGVWQLWLDGVHFDGVEDAKILCLFVKIFPRLRDLQLRNPTHIRVLVWMVRRYQQTLESLDVTPQLAHHSLVPEICRLRLPRLKRISFDAREPFSKNDWIQLLEAQPLLDELMIDVDRSAILIDIARTAPAIKALSLYISHPIALTFLNEFGRLRSLDINGYSADLSYSPLVIGGGTVPVRCPNLRQFRLFRVTFFGMLDFFASCSALESLVFDDVKFELLIHETPPASLTFPHLRSIDISGCFYFKTLLRHIFAHSPLLEDVRLTHTIEVDDDLILVLCTEAKRLRKLELEQCIALSDASGAHIIDHCAALEELRLYRNFMSAEMMQKLRSTRNIRIWCSYYAEPLELEVMEE